MGGEHTQLKHVIERAAVEAYLEGVSAGRMKAAFDIRQQAVKYVGAPYRRMEMCARIAEGDCGRLAAKVEGDG